MTCLRTVKVKTFILDDKPFNFVPSIARPLAMALAVELKTEAAQFLSGILDPVYGNVDRGYQLFWDIRRYKYTGNHWNISTVMASIVYSRLVRNSTPCAFRAPRTPLAALRILRCPSRPWSWRRRCGGSWSKCCAMGNGGWRLCRGGMGMGRMGMRMWWKCHEMYNNV